MMSYYTGKQIQTVENDSNTCSSSPRHHGVPSLEATVTGSGDIPSIHSDRHVLGTGTDHENLKAQ